MKNFKVKMDYDIKQFEEKAKKLIDDINLEAHDIVKKSAIVFANSAAKWTPPRKGGSPSLVIPKEKYERPFVLLSALIAEQYPGLSATEIDRAQFKKGMKFKIYNTRKNKQERAPAYAYCRTKSELKKLRKIEHRGLAKVMWGKSLDTIGINVPIGIQRLIRKSPALESLTYSETSFEAEGDKTSVTIKNSASDIEKYAKSAEKYGYEKAMLELKRRLTEIAKKEQKL